MTNTTVHAKITAVDSFYREVMGEVVKADKGWLQVRATRVMDKWSKAFEDHPTSCMVWVKESDVVAI